MTTLGGQKGGAQVRNGIQWNRAPQCSGFHPFTRTLRIGSERGGAIDRFSPRLGLDQLPDGEGGASGERDAWSGPWSGLRQVLRQGVALEVALSVARARFRGCLLPQVSPRGRGLPLGLTSPLRHPTAPNTRKRKEVGAGRTGGGRGDRAAGRLVPPGSRRAVRPALGVPVRSCVEHLDSDRTGTTRGRVASSPSTARRAQRRAARCAPGGSRRERGAPGGGARRRVQREPRRDGCASASADGSGVQGLAKAPGTTGPRSRGRCREVVGGAGPFGRPCGLRFHLIRVGRRCDQRRDQTCDQNRDQRRDERCDQRRDR